MISESHLLLQGSMIDDGKLSVMNIDMTLNDANDATGKVTINVTDGCVVTNDLKLTRSGTSDSDPDPDPNPDGPSNNGGGGSCFVEALQL